MSKSAKALAVGSKQDWSISVYCFTRAACNNLIWEKDAAAKTALKHYFQKHLTSTPVFKHSTSRVIIQLYYYADPLHVDLATFQLDPLRTLLSNVYGPAKELDLRITRLFYPYLNSEILARYLALNSQNSSWPQLTRKFMRSVPIVKAPAVPVASPMVLHWGNLLPHAGNGTIASAVQGIKYQVSGRLGRKRGASRTSTMRKSAGTFKFTSTKSLIDVGRHSFTNKNGSITVKVWISTALFGVGAAAARAGVVKAVRGAGTETMTVKKV
ncbi:hypothetical protein BC938DRAFT_474114 [Jimgerdemannia flammicorona]|uniref:Small ribosomal subunit protein uS3m n=1 Tax=Jimgerdemannia flammicorona TaxID=994334 RepID=A0A433QST4_9FUNG|nr:hypothetical protein BC938DRAFT_474114 [Jimgerdemannia flammicorona]